ncbi:MAG: UDP-N-acetylmuramoyl-tripeptide--D-alanyl-D-alanine ligase, partial [Myxococcales bacterium]|nr:UDP-N-acetylmuramoyl-tripeptide--D-alanyl-D-alanine ligase [Myxococcales bacterium]
MATPIPKNAARFSLGEVAAFTGGEVIGDRALTTVGVSTDSRAVGADALFVALVGARFDAHRFVSDLRARAFVVSDASALPEGASAVVVPDTLEALGALATHHARRWRSGAPSRRLVAITGSAGKTSTKELTLAALHEREPVGTVGNLNNLVGVPMTLFTLDETHVAVVEMGTNARGEIAKLGAMGEPDVAVVTLVAAAHTEGIGTEEDVFVEKTSLLSTMRRGGQGIVNGDDVRLRTIEGVLRYGRSEGCDVRVLSWTMDGARTHVTWDVRGRRIEGRLQLVGEAAAVNGAAALAVASVVGGVDLESAVEGMEALAPVAGRMSPRGGVGGALVLDDTYNANPSSVLLALRTAKTVADARGGRLVAVLGDMKELGALSREKHAEVRNAAEAVAQCVFVGPEMAAVGAAVDDAS